MLPILHRVRFKLHYWPMLSGLWFAFTFTLTYTIAVSYGHVYYFWPYISDTGAFPPESCVFSQFTNIGVIFISITLYLRYVQMKFALSSAAINSKYNINRASLWIGLVACIGINLVANFQENSPLYVFHYSGAISIFIFGSVYIISQTKLSRDLMLHGVITQYSTSLVIFYARAAIAILIFPVFLVNLTLSSLAMEKYNGTNVYQWSPNEDYYGLRLGSTISEWILFISFGSFIMTYTNEFKALQFDGIMFKSILGLSKFENQERVV